MEYFLCIGAQKAGTTWLYSAFEHHPEIDLTPVKELHFFDELEIMSKYPFPLNYFKARRFLHRRINYLLMSKYLKKHPEKDIVGGVNDLILRSIAWMNPGRYRKFKKDLSEDHSNERLDWLIRFNTFSRRSKNLSVYKELIDASVNQGKIVGEVTPSYAHLNKKTIRLIKEVFPNPKLLLSLRNPIERDWSQIRMRYRRFYSNMEWDDYLNYVKKDFSSINVKSNYLETIDNFTNIFGRESLKILIFDQLQSDPLGFLNEATSHLGVRPFERVPQDIIQNKGHDQEIPEDLKASLAEIYAPMIKELCNHSLFSGNEYLNRWLQDVEIRP